jgi:hypothetical protein
MTTNLISRNSNAATAQAAAAVLILPDDETDATVAAADKSKDFHYCNHHHHHHHHELLEAHCIHSSCPTKIPNLVSPLQAETTLSSTAQLQQAKNPNPNANHVNKKLNDDGKNINNESTPNPKFRSHCRRIDPFSV